MVGVTGKAGALATGVSEAGAGIATGVVEPRAEELEPELDEVDIAERRRILRKNNVKQRQKVS